MGGPPYMLYVLTGGVVTAVAAIAASVSGVGWAQGLAGQKVSEI